MADNGPNKSDIEAIFKRLRSIPTNKTCFDCGAKNPTWSSVTYGVFICIDCSAVHRSLGVHITFVRSTQLDTAWTWPQLRNMQLGGNANAHSFFHQHNCTSSDAQQKYKSRAAQLYKEKLANMSAQAMRIYGNQVHIETGHSNEQAAPEKKELDFFTEAESEAFNKLSYEPQATVTPVSTASKEQQPTEAPNAEALINAGDAAKPAGKSIIAQRKTVAKKPGLGAKKGLGAMKIQTNFEDIEREAQMADQLRTKAPEPQAKAQEPDDKQMASLRLAYQDLSVETKKQTEKLQKVDPNKAQQMERLGMGILSGSSGARNVSHSALSDMQVIQQDSSAVNSSSVLASLDRKKSPLMDEYSSPSSSIFNKGSGIDDLFSSKPTSSYDDRWDMLEELSQPATSKPSSSYSSSSSAPSAPRSSGYGKPAAEPAANSGEALKKFGNAKAISSDQFFQDSGAADYERRSNLSRFEGSSSISSADYFGTGGSDSGASSRGYAAGRPAAYNLQAPDFDEVKESVRQGVTKVASRLSNMANNLASSIQERYGY